MTTYDSEAREAISALNAEVDANAATDVWEAALAAKWHDPPIWIHGDVTAANLLVVDGRLSAVIDFGCSGVGDPACDVTIAWTFLLGESREAFRDRLPLDDGTWARGRGWAFWKALITLPQTLKNGAQADPPTSAWEWRLSAPHTSSRKCSPTTTATDEFRVPTPSKDRTPTRRRTKWAGSS
ncbi:hypothetical protein BH18ACT12_BH18ACT12_06510 [soil metagenome]